MSRRQSRFLSCETSPSKRDKKRRHRRHQRDSLHRRDSLLKDKESNYKTGERSTRQRLATLTFILHKQRDGY